MGRGETRAEGEGGGREEMGKGKGALNKGDGEAGAAQMLEKVGKQLGAGGGEAA